MTTTAATHLPLVTAGGGRRRDPGARAKQGRAARKRVPHASHAEWRPAPDRPDPVGVLAAQAASRLPELVPIRHGRMLVSPFTYYRGAAAVMASDLASTPVSGFVTQLCGDAHLTNFGAYASPERNLVFDINDFDETFPGPWEWDVKRLAASFVIAARDNGFGRKERAAIVRTTVCSYRTAMARFAALGDLDVWYARADTGQAGRVLTTPPTKQTRKRFERAEAKARTHDSLQALRKLTGIVDGQRRILADPPLVVPVQDLLPDVERKLFEEQLRGLLRGYRRTLADDRRHLLDGFEFVDMARKVVGVGSVGTRCWIVLLRGRDDTDPLLLQVKEAQPSVVAPYIMDSGVLPCLRHGGERVVAGQRLMQAVSDIFLGWQTAPGIDGQARDFYVRQLRDWKQSAVVEAMDAATMRSYGDLCGWVLARAHARTGDRVAIAAYLGDGDTFDRALLEFAERYADQSEQDHAALAAAAGAGRIPVVTGV
ncbi:DUF2252 domain-containing protein [Phytohabitans suffuscus]|uniref:DUF2252 domain-containing protein n=1 Tax=Phytohabitans suffuscus TaxID=624315 RepID=A0A6F8YQ66_9ACTN|nr:DUF2252 domain-containing protein [Phytohabitans suffuscus]BCB88189.1 hypothetical protein Psuf_055020 [Phytohabitans suffuscus]